MKLKPDLAPKIVYQGDCFTVARAEIMIGNSLFSAEGVARKSCLDFQDQNMGMAISSGRALKALAKKVICHRAIRHRFMG
jgi:hypothetical protein